MPLRVYNTLTQTKEPFQTVQPGRVGMYVCGPTVYSPSHIGHMVGPVIFDTIKRYLVYLGYEVTWVVNITDVDDKLIVQAQTDGTTVQELAARVTRDYLDCLASLGVERHSLPVQRVGVCRRAVSRAWAGNRSSDVRRPGNRAGGRAEGAAGLQLPSRPQEANQREARLTR